MWTGKEFHMIHSNCYTGRFVKCLCMQSFYETFLWITVKQFQCIIDAVQAELKVVWVSSGNSEEEFYWKACITRVPLHCERWEHKQRISRADLGMLFPHNSNTVCRPYTIDGSKLFLSSLTNNAIHNYNSLELVASTLRCIQQSNYRHINL